MPEAGAAAALGDDCAGGGRTAPALPPRRHREQGQRPAHHGIVADARIGREAGHRHDVGAQHALAELRQLRDDVAVRRDDGRDAVVRRANQEASGLDGAQPRYLQMLVRRGRVPEPGIVGDVDEERRLAQNPELSAAEGVLVADGERELLPCGAQGGLAFGARQKSSEGRLMSRIQERMNGGTGKYSPKGTR